MYVLMVLHSFVFFFFFFFLYSKEAWPPGRSGIFVIDILPSCLDSSHILGFYYHIKSSP